MRKILALIVFLLILFVPHSAAAEDVPPYVRVLTNDVYLYAAANNSKPLFALEQTYYAEVKGVEGGYYRVEISDNVGMFNKITGYVLISKVDAVYEIPATPFYPSVSVSVIADSAKIFLYPDADSSVLMRATNSQTMAYYGSIVTGGINWYFVCCGDYLGYVMSSSVSKAAVSPHPTPLPTTVIEPEDPALPADNPSEDPSAGDATEQSFDGVQLALILLIIIPSVVIVFMLFAPSQKGGKKREKQNYKSVATTTRTAEEKRPKPRYFDDYL